MAYNIFDCYRIDLNIFKWEEVKCYDITKIYYAYADFDLNVALFGGLDSEADSNELALASLSNTSISLATITPNLKLPPPRFGHSLHSTRDYLWLFGGENNGE